MKLKTSVSQQQPGAVRMAAHLPGVALTGTDLPAL